MDEYRKYEPVFGSWYLGRLLGKGSFGKVFEITREEFGTTYRSALKIITVPQDENDIKSRMSEGSDLASVSAYYEGILREIVNENEIMAQLKGNSNIVSYEDHQIIPHDDGIGYDILIRMELLTPLLDRMVERRLDEREVVKLGIDMCKALETCHRKNIIHRDIKPQNIFISDNGDFKLGDFGIARTMEKTTGGMSKKGTYKYMAPEVFRGEHYDSTVDIYSLGIVLYSLLNGNRGPFLPAPPARVTPNDEETARMRRFRGEPLPPPRDAGPMLAYIIQKASAADPRMRYQTAEQMRRDLENYQANYNMQAAPAFVPYPAGMPVYDQGMRPYTGSMPAAQINAASPVNVASQINAAPKKKKSNKGLIAVIAAVAIALSAVGIFLVTRMSAGPVELNLGDLLADPAVSGYDGEGVIAGTLTVDDSKKMECLAGIKNDEKRARAESLINKITFTAVPSEALSNGDTVTIKAAYDADLAESADIVVSGTETSFEVSGLKEFPQYLRDAIEFNGHYYKLVNESILWTEAKSACEQMNGHLVTITSADEQKFIVSLIEDYGTKYNFWLGGTDEGHEGTFTWITGEPWGYANWRKDQPNNKDSSSDGDQNYLQLCCVSKADTGRYGKWWDMSNSGLSVGYESHPYYKSPDYSGYICEWDGLE